MRHSIVEPVKLDPIGSRLGAIVRSEDYHLYWLRRDRLDDTAPAAQCGP